MLITSINKEDEIRTLKIEAMPDTGAWTLVINEDVREKLGLTIKETSESTLADGKANTYDVTEGVEIRWKDRYTVLPAVGGSTRRKRHTPGRSAV
ncbi:MAG: aspartyl protease family protein [Treponema sp.]|nr:aspartyl protease family protein [Treponema sp.]